MDPIIVLLIVVVVVVAGVAIYFWSQRQRTQRLAERFGPEYQHAVDERDDRRQAEAELEARQKRVEKLEIRRMAPDERDAFARRWEEVQARFVDQPDEAIRDADRLVQQVMEARGYPVGDFEQRASDVSVDHPQVVQYYRSAHGIAQRHADGGVDTEELRVAVVDYRALFDDLLETDDQAEAGRGEGDRGERMETHR
jgi:hypothetical protein